MFANVFTTFNEIAFATMELQAEQDLLRRLAGGDEQALSALYREYWHCLFMAAYNVVRDKRTCEDIVQEIFLQLWLRRNSLQVRDSLKAYLLAATRYQVFRAVRKAAEQRTAMNGLAIQPDQPLAEQQLVHKDLQRQLESTILNLPEKCRQIYRLSREEFLSHKEISVRLQISTKTVENQLTIALRRLRHSLQGFLLLAFTVVQL